MGDDMDIKKFLESLSVMLKERGGIDTEIVSDRNFDGGFYLNFPEFSTAVLRVNKDGKFSIRSVESTEDKFEYPFSYKFLIPTNSTVEKLGKTFANVHFDGERELTKAVFPVFCYVSVLHQFYKRSLAAKKTWFVKYKEIEKRKFEKIRSVCSGLPSRQALKLLTKDDQVKMF